MKELDIKISDYYNTNGIPSKSLKENSFSVQEVGQDFSFDGSDILYQNENQYINLYDLFKEKIFSNKTEFYNLLPKIGPFYYYGGIDAELNIPKEEFAKLADVISKDSTGNKLLYYFDCEKIIATLQNSLTESKYLIGQFYKILNENSFLIQEDLAIVADGIQFASGPIVTNITSLVNHIFINLHSQLDFVTKLCYEIQNIHTDFSIYPKLKSKNILYGDKKRLSINGASNSLFEQTDLINMIFSLRNEIVHNSSIDNNPKVYQVIKGKKVVEKFILLPDMENGIIKSYKNRNRFYYNDTKLNEELPSIMFNFWKRLNCTLQLID